jgi:hypothetical protein
MQVSIFKLLQRVISGRISFFLLQTLLLFGLTTCQKDPVATRDYPRLSTLEVSGISATGAKFSAEIISGDPTKVIEYGFAWSEYSPDPSLGTDANLDIQGSIVGKSFSSSVQTLTNDKVYNLRSFIKTSDLLIYGRVVTFRTSK